VVLVDHRKSCFFINTEQYLLPTCQAWYCSIQSTTPLNFFPLILQSSVSPIPQTRLAHQPQLSFSWVSGGKNEARRLTRSTLVLLAEEEKLGLVVDGEHTGTGNTTEDVGTSTLEERLDTLSGDDLAGGIHGRLVLDGLNMMSE